MRTLIVQQYHLRAKELVLRYLEVEVEESNGSS